MIITGRERDVARAVKYLSKSNADEASSNVLILSGPGGIGKTVLAQAIHGELLAQGRRVALVSLDDASTKSPLGILSTVSLRLDRNHFTPFLEKVTRYQDEDQSRRQRQFNELVDQFKSLLNAFVIEYDGGTIGLDNIESAEPGFRRWLMRVLESIHPKLSLYVTSRSPQTVRTGRVQQVEEFDRPDIDQVLQGIGFKPDDADLDRIIDLTGGNPLRVETLGQALGEHGVELLRAASTFEEFFSRRLKRLSTDEQRTLAYLATFRFRFNDAMLAALSEADLAAARQALNKLDRLPFVIGVEASTERRLHDAFLELVRKNFELSSKFAPDTIEQLVRNYYDVELTQTDDPRLRRLLHRERLAYQAITQSDAGVEHLCVEIQRSINSFDFDQAEALLNVGRTSVASLHDVSRIEVMRAQYLLETFEPAEAVEVLNQVAVMARDLNDPWLAAQRLRLEGKAVANPAPVPHGDLFKAIDLLGEALEVCKRSGLDGLRAFVEFDFARALRSAGQNSRALKLYETLRAEALHSGMYDLAVRCLEEESQTYRLMQNLTRAEDALNQSYRLRVEHNVLGGKGFADYYAANTYRDTDRFAQARRCYQAAEALFIQSGDVSNLCAMYADWAWLEYLADDVPAVRMLQNESFELATRYRFGAELAEHWHTMYHLAFDEEDYDQAYDYLNRGLAEAKRSNNMYMILDCLMHTAQRALAEGEPEVIARCLEEMEAYERRGCGMYVFRGRAMMFMGDFRYQEGSYTAAYNAWRDGFITVAKYGNSRSNVELFADMLARRYDKLREVVDELELHDSLRVSWDSAGLSADFPDVLRICDRRARL